MNVAGSWSYFRLKSVCMKWEYEHVTFSCPSIEGEVPLVAVVGMDGRDFVAELSPLIDAPVEFEPGQCHNHG